jgi:hypothetical protein
MSRMPLRSRIIAAASSGLLICVALVMIIVAGLDSGSGAAPTLVGSVHPNDSVLVPTTCHANAHHKCAPSTLLATPAPT